ncbi:MAG: cytochrome c oxidase subunit II [Anaerolineae bacterium]
MMFKRLCRTLAIAAPLLLTGACASVAISPPNPPSTLDPRGPAAAHIASLWWLMFVLGTVVWLLVVVLLFAGILRRRRATQESAAESGGHDTGRNWPLFAIAMSVLILGVVFGYNVYALRAVENPPGKPPLKLLVTGRRWWWEVRYPSGMETANEIHIPVGVPVQIELRAYDVIHSFWVPQLHGKMDAIPTRINYLTIQADQPGVYRGECAEFCGLQHAHMGFMVIAQSKADYDAWLNGQNQPAPKPADAVVQKGQQVFLSQGCAFCHTIRGVDDSALVRTNVRLGPDLTHLASRVTIAGASLSNTRGNLQGWVVDPQHVKPGALMPENYIDAADLQALITYLETLH